MKTESHLLVLPEMAKEDVESEVDAEVIEVTDVEAVAAVAEVAQDHQPNELETCLTVVVRSLLKAHINIARSKHALSFG